MSSAEIDDILQVLHLCIAKYREKPLHTRRKFIAYTQLVSKGHRDKL